jgi:hypothetical protein
MSEFLCARPFLVILHLPLKAFCEPESFVMGVGEAYWLAGMPQGVFACAVLRC